MHNVWLILKREYMERVRTKSFVISTLLFPVLIVGLIVIPARMVMLKSPATKRLVVVASRADVAEAVKAALERTPKAAVHEPGVANQEIAAPPSYEVAVNLTTTKEERSLLTARVTAGTLDGYLWLPEESLHARQASYYARETSDYLQRDEIERAVNRALLRYRLAEHGMSASQMDTVLAPVDLQTVTLDQGKESSASGLAQFMSVFVLILLLYLTLVIYGVAVMRSVLEEKSSRVVEVLLSAVTPKQMMAGKLLGVGAVGLTQVCIWMLLSALLLAPGVLALGDSGKIDIPLTLLPAFAVFFVLGYMLYSAMFAALGAMVNSEQEGQQFQLIVTLPLIVPMILLSFVIRQPSAPLSVWMSMVPLFSPVLMYVRMVVQMPPLWQITLSLAILVATIYAVLVLCSRIYRVGILMYGKKPGIAEIFKWIRYA
ncbi:MAG: ABC transporter permease [Candidatus Korobacteraceae bacterium]